MSELRHVAGHLVRRDSEKPPSVSKCGSRFADDRAPDYWAHQLEGGSARRDPRTLTHPSPRHTARSYTHHHRVPFLLPSATERPVPCSRHVPLTVDETFQRCSFFFLFQALPSRTAGVSAKAGWRENVEDDALRISLWNSKRRNEMPFFMENTLRPELKSKIDCF